MGTEAEAPSSLQPSCLNARSQLLRLSRRGLCATPRRASLWAGRGDPVRWAGRGPRTHGLCARLVCRCWDEAHPQGVRVCSRSSRV